MGKKRSAAIGVGLGILAISSILVGLFLEYQSSRVTGSTTDSFLVNLTFTLFLIASAIVGALIISRQIKNTIGWLLLFYPLITGWLSWLDPLVIAPRQNQPPSLAVYLSAWVNQWGWWFLTGPILLIALLFPNGKFLSRRWKGVAVLLVAAFVCFVTGATFSPTFEIDAGVIQNPLSSMIPAGLYNILLLLFQILLLTTVGLSAASVFVRYRRVRVEERAQIKWFLYACGVFAATFLIGFTQSGGSFFDVLFNIALIGIPLAIGAAILRYHLYDINFIINRTLVYVPLTAILAGLYSVTLAATQKYLVSTTGEKSDTALALTTFLLVALFTPMKNFLQQIVDRRFKETPTGLKQINALEKQISTVAEVLDQRTMMNRLLKTLVSGLNASGGAIYLDENGNRRMVFSTPGWDPDSMHITFPFAAEGRQLGVLCLGARKSGGEYRMEEKQALQKTMDAAAKILAGSSLESAEMYQ